MLRRASDQHLRVRRAAWAAWPAARGRPKGREDLQLNKRAGLGGAADEEQADADDGSDDSDDATEVSLFVPADDKLDEGSQTQERTSAESAPDKLLSALRGKSSRRDGTYL